MLLNLPPPNIALVDDIPVFIDGFTSYLRKTNCVNILFTATDGIDFLLKLNSQKMLPKIVFIDMQMPRMDGIALTYYLSTWQPEIICIGLSSYAEPMHVQQFLKAGAKGFLNKQYDIALLKNVLEIIKAGAFFIDPIIPAKELILEQYATEKNIQPSLSKELQPREKQYLQLAITDSSLDEIAGIMNVSTTTLKNYQYGLRDKYDIHSRQAATNFALQHGITDIAKGLRS